MCRWAWIASWRVTRRVYWWAYPWGLQGQAAKMGGRGPFPANPLPFPLLQPVPTGPLQQQIKPIELEKIRLLFDKMLR